MIRKFYPFDVYAISPQEKQNVDIASFSLDLAKTLAAYDSYTCEANGEIHAVGGIATISEHRGYVWSIIGQGAGPYMIEIYRAAKSMVENSSFTRLEMDVACDFPQGFRLAEMLGFTCEAPCMKGYRPDGTDSALFARVR